MNNVSDSDYSSAPNTSRKGVKQSEEERQRNVHRQKKKYIGVINEEMNENATIEELNPDNIKLPMTPINYKNSVMPD